MAPGARVPSERELAEHHGVSLMTARRALVELARLGLVTRRVGAGTFVAPGGGGVRRLRDPHDEYQAPECRLAGKAGEWVREWWAGQTLVVEERVTLTEEGALGVRPLLDFLGEAAAYAAEEIRAEGDWLRVRQTIYGTGQEPLAVREMAVKGRRLEGWLER